MGFPVLQARVIWRGGRAASLRSFPHERIGLGSRRGACCREASTSVCGTAFLGALPIPSNGALTRRHSLVEKGATPTVQGRRRRSARPRQIGVGQRASSRTNGSIECTAATIPAGTSQATDSCLAGERAYRPPPATRSMTRRIRSGRGSPDAGLCSGRAHLGVAAVRARPERFVVTRSWSRASRFGAGRRAVTLAYAKSFSRRLCARGSIAVGRGCSSRSIEVDRRRVGRRERAVDASHATPCALVMDTRIPRPRWWLWIGLS